MTEDTSLSLIKSLINSYEELVAIFEDEELILTNSSFNNFFKVNSIQEYNKKFSSLEKNFALHPLYFNKEKILDGELWFDSILKLDKIDRVVSMINTKYEPQAFSVKIDNVENFRIITFVNITQSLIKRIMIENKSNIDKRSGAYAKKYFLQILPSYETAAIFNEKIIGLSSIKISSSDELNNDTIKKFVDNLKFSIRQDDMLIRWSRENFIVIYLVDSEEKVKQVINKLKNVVDKNNISGLTYKFSSTWQKEKDSIDTMLEKII